MSKLTSEIVSLQIDGRKFFTELLNSRPLSPQFLPLHHFLQDRVAYLQGRRTSHYMCRMRFSRNSSCTLHWEISARGYSCKRNSFWWYGEPSVSGCVTWHECETCLRQSLDSFISSPRTWRCRLVGYGVGWCG